MANRTAHSFCSGRGRMQHDRTGIAASFGTHAIVIIVLSFIVFRQETVKPVETTVLIRDEAPGGVTTTIVEDESLAPEIVQTFDEMAAAEDSVVVPVGVGLLVPQGLDDSTIKDESGATGESTLLTGVDAVVAEIQDRVRKAGGKTGDVQFSLSWEDRNDLDLHVVTPKGDRIHFHQRKARCGGHLDVDMNVKPKSDEPVENVRWPKGRGQTGRYTIYVNFYRHHVGSRTVAFNLVAKLGDESKLVRSEVFPGKHLRIYRFIHVGSNVSESRGRNLRTHFEELQVEEEEIASRLLREAKASKPLDNRKLMKVAYGYPHTDAALEALRLLPDKPQK